MKDPIVQSVIDQYLERSSGGIKKYGKTLKLNEDGGVRFLQHLQEELMDATLYIEKIKQDLKDSIDLEMTKLYHALLLAQEAAYDKPLAPCDVEDVFFQLGHNIDKLPF